MCTNKKSTLKVHHLKKAFSDTLRGIDQILHHHPNYSDEVGCGHYLKTEIFREEDRNLAIIHKFHSSCCCCYQIWCKTSVKPEDNPRIY